MRARRGGSGALYPQSAIAGFHPPFEARRCGDCRANGALNRGTRATEDCEPCQILTEAALSGPFRVPRGLLRGATGNR